MSKATNTKLMDTEPGGENTQYESQDTFVRPPKKSTGQFGATQPSEDTEADVHRAAQQQERGEKTAENVRYGEAISEHGLGGETVGNSGKADDVSAGNGGTSSEERVKQERARREMGYGEGSGVGG
ncbi:hypothetical protein BKA65DRAFT_495894 [Rhexocercosporidium sp. MPI-PUGE-AT-0058]|nr:hypothetical protein BKA65DRAFT_495894 [Rhexocercosporidium sp. MPI-PUGE-AT-0058]